MTEQEWLASSDPTTMLRSLTNQRIPTYQANYQTGWLEQELLDPKISDRKLRLFAEACGILSGKTPEGMEHAAMGVDAFRWAIDWSQSVPGTISARLPQGAKAAVLRDIIGNPWRPIGRCRSWLTWHDGTIPNLAQAIYDERAFDRLPILADALEDAGCDNADILAHCRGPGPHVRGCWVIDLLLGKE